MQVPLQITFEELPHSEAVESRIRQETEKLEKYYGRIISARVAISKPQHRHSKGDAYQVRIHLTLPGTSDIAVARSDVDPYLTVRDAFKAARRQLQDTVKKRQALEKERALAAH